MLNDNFFALISLRGFNIQKYYQQVYDLVPKFY